MIDERTRISAANNADLYAAVFQAHGARYERHADTFWGLDPAPPYYSDVTCLAPDLQNARIHALADRIATATERVGVKDSFCALSLEGLGLGVLFVAHWFWRDAPSRIDVSDWQRVTTDADLRLWENAWTASGSPVSRRMFPAAMLSDPNILFLGRPAGAEFDAGCIANRSRDCVGLSNVFSRVGLTDVMQQAANAVQTHVPDLPLVGYLADAKLANISHGGFDVLGPLRVCLSR